MEEIPDAFIIQCRTNYFSGIRPAHQQSKNTDGYNALVQIAKDYFDADRYDDFSGNFMEGQYFINLWAAHLTFEYGQPNESQKEQCLEIIKRYSDNPLAPEVAIEEKIWLDNYYKA
jgi:hypothetical protein